MNAIKWIATSLISFWLVFLLTIPAAARDNSCRVTPHMERLSEITTPQQSFAGVLSEANADGLLYPTRARPGYFKNIPFRVPAQSEVEITVIVTQLSGLGLSGYGFPTWWLEIRGADGKMLPSQLSQIVWHYTAVAVTGEDSNGKDILRWEWRGRLPFQTTRDLDVILLLSTREDPVTYIIRTRVKRYGDHQFNIDAGTEPEKALPIVQGTTIRGHFVSPEHHPRTIPDWDPTPPVFINEGRFPAPSPVEPVEVSPYYVDFLDLYVLKDVPLGTTLNARILDTKLRKPPGYVDGGFMVGFIDYVDQLSIQILQLVCEEDGPAYLIRTPNAPTDNNEETSEEVRVKGWFVDFDDLKGTDTFIATYSGDYYIALTRPTFHGELMQGEGKHPVEYAFIVETNNFQNDDIVNFYPVKTDAVFAYVGGVDVTRPDASNRKGLWHGKLPEEEAKKYGPDHRLLIIYGENILDILDGDPVIEAVGSDTEYEILEIAPPDWYDVLDSPYHRTWTFFYDHKTRRMNEEDKQAFREIEKYLVMAKLPEGKTAGIEKFHINAIEAKWVLLKGNVTADLSIIRVPTSADPSRPPQEVPDILNYFFTSDRIMVEVRLSNEVELDEVPVVLRVDYEIVRIDGKGELMALPVPGRPGLYRTPVLTRVAPNGSGRVAPDAKKLPIGEGGILSATLPRAASVTMRFPAAAMFQPRPDVIGNHWKSRVREVAVLANKLDTYNADPNAFLRKKVGEVDFTHVTGSQKIPIRAGDHAALLILRRSFVDQMKPVYKELSELDQKLGDDPFMIHGFYQMLKPRMSDPTFPYRFIDVDHPVKSMFQFQVPFLNAFDEDYLGRTFGVYWAREEWILKATRQAFDRYMEATKFAIDHAEGIEDDGFEELLQLVSMGFDGVAQRTVPNIVALSTFRPLHWVPDNVARGYVASVNEKGKRYRANRDLTRAEVNLALAAAIPIIMFPVSVPLQIISTGLSVAFVGEALIYEVPEAFQSRREAKLALGAVTLLGPDRVDLAQSQKVPAGVEALVVLGSFVGLGADFVALVHSIRIARAAQVGSRALDLMETGGFQVFVRLSEEEQVAVAALMQEARNVNMVDPSQLTALQRRALNASRRIGDGADHIRELRLRDRLMVGGHRTGKEYKFKTGKAGGIEPPKLDEGSLFEGMTIGRELGVGSNARVYEIIGPDGTVVNDRVLKIFQYFEEGEDVVERSLYVARVLEEKGVPQLRIIGSGITDEGLPYLVQERLSKSQHTYELVFQAQKVLDVDGADFLGHYSGLREFSRLNPDDPSKLLLRKLPRPLQRAYMRLLGQVNDPGTGRGVLIWEDPHLENVYFEQVGRNEWRAGILDQDRIMPWGHRLPADHEMYMMQGNIVNLTQMDAERFKIFSLVNARLPEPASRMVTIVNETSALYPSSRFYQAKLLESKGFILFEPSTQTWTSRILDLDIVEEFFPQLREWVNFDFHTFHPPQ